MNLLYESEYPSFEQELVEGTGEKKYRIKGVWSSPGVRNKNGRVYPMDIWEQNIAAYQKELEQGTSNTLMELNHPPRSNVEMMEAVAKVEKMYIKDGKVYGEATLLNNPKANQLKTLIDAGIKMSVSTRGVGNVNSDGVVEKFKLITTDIIPDQGQSDHAAEMFGIVEGVLQDKEFMLTESGSIEEVQVCAESGCKLADKSLVQEAVKQKFDEVLKMISEKE